MLAVLCPMERSSARTSLPMGEAGGGGENVGTRGDSGGRGESIAGGDGCATSSGASEEDSAASDVSAMADSCVEYAICPASMNRSWSRLCWIGLEQESSLARMVRAWERIHAVVLQPCAAW